MADADVFSKHAITQVYASQRVVLMENMQEKFANVKGIYQSSTISFYL